MIKIYSMKELVNVQVETNKKLQEALIRNNLNDIFGNDFLKDEITNLYIKDCNLYIKVSNSNVLHYLVINKENIKKRLEKIYSFEIKDIIFRNN